MRKNTRIWITLIWLPFVSLILVAVLQVIAQFVFSTVDGSSSSPVLINIISLLVGIFGVFGILLMPLWIIMLVKATNYNKSIAEPPNHQSAESEIVDL